MATKFKHSYKEFGTDAVRKRIQSMLAFRDDVNVSDAHVKFSTSNRKTGAKVPSVSLIPVADCGNCSACARGCYDVRSSCFHTTVQKSRANNSAILKADRDRFFAEVKDYVRKVRFFRWNVGGDMKDFLFLKNVVKIAEDVPTCEFLIFTKMFPIVNVWLDNAGPFPKNLHVIFSDWKGVEWFDNPHNLPVSSPLWADGSTGAHCTEKTFLCPGSCEECAEEWKGCWAAKDGDTILFEAH